MARLSDSGQWIILMAILISIALFFLAFILNQATIVGQTTSEGVLEFSKNDIQDLRAEIMEWAKNSRATYRDGQADIRSLAQFRKNTIVTFSISDKFESVGLACYYPISFHFNNGVTEYEERITYYIESC